MRIFLLSLLLPLVAFAAAPAPTHGLSIFGTLKYPANFAHFDYVNPDAPRGGTVKLAASGTFDSVNPFIVKGNKAPASASVFESLMVGSLDEPQSMYGLIAESATLAPDRSSIDFAMRPEAKFHDGSPITADDVVFSLNAFKKDADPTYRISYEPVEAAIKLDDHHVRFTFKDKTKRELPLIVASMPILSKAYYTNHEFTKTALEPPLASGPYKITQVDQGRSITFTRVKNYWGEKLPVNIGQNNFDAIRYDMYRDETVALEALKAGEYDFREESIARAWNTGYDSPPLRDGRLKKEIVRNQVPQGMQSFVFNIRRAKFADARVREAIGLTMDFEWMNKTLFWNTYERDTSFFINTPYAATGLPSAEELALLNPYKEQLPPALFTQEFHVPTTDGTGNNRPNLLKADRLLNDAGWVIKDGVRVNEKTGEPLTFEFLLHLSAFERVAAPMRKHLKRLGIETRIRVVDEAQYQKRLDQHDFDMVSIWINRFVFYPGNEQLTYWHSTQADQEGSNNLVGTKSPVIDTLLAKLTSAGSEAELQPPARALDRVLLFEHYVVPHWNLSAFRIAYWDKFGRPALIPAYSLGFQTWWMDEEKKKH